MSINRMIIEPRQRDIGNFLVGRLLPFRKKRSVGPFIFIDQMGPAEIGPENYFDIDQHPHIGLCTLTYLLEGEIEHRDSTGAIQRIKPGDAGLMTAGKGVTHTERTPSEIRDGSRFTMRGYQIWLALPAALEECQPRFDHFEANSLPAWEQDGMRIRLVAGSAFGRQSPLPGTSPMFMVDLYSENETVLNPSDHLEGELAVVIAEGSIKHPEGNIEKGNMLISKTDEEAEIRLAAGSRILLFGGEQMPEEHFLLWNFASSSKERLQKAREDWVNQIFPKVPGDTTYVPFP